MEQEKGKRGELVTIATGKHTLSPHLLNLKPNLPAPEDLIEAYPNIRLNLMHPSLSAPTVTPKPLTDPLKMNREHVAWQLGEVPAKIPRVLPAPKNRETAAPFAIPGQRPITLEAFEPKQTPEDILAYFDLPDPEPDETEESELVEFTEGHHSTGELSTVKPETPSHSPVPISKPFFPFRFPSSPLVRPIAAFVAISFVFVLPLHAMHLVSSLRETKAEVTATSQEALTSLAAGVNADALSRASERFAKARLSISEMGVAATLLLSAIPSANRRLSSGRALVEAGERLTTAGGRLSEAMEAMARETNPTPVSRIRLLTSYVASALPHLKRAQTLLETADKKDVPEAHRATFEELQQRLPRVTATLEQFASLSNFAVELLGGEGTKRYLLVFQNNTEIRATGGFMGSFAELKVRDGVIENLSVPGGGTYDLQGQLRTTRAAPEPLQLLSARWEFQDANWFPDFPTSARQMITFYRDAGGPSVDGVVALNATFVVDLIGLLGPIEMEAYGRTITAENFLFEAQKIVEVEYDRQENRPKQFIGDLAPRLMERALEGGPEMFLTLADALSQGLAKREVQMYFADEEAQRTALAQRWGGALLQPSGDYLMVVNTNLGGGKTDGVIEEDVNVQVEIAEDGSIVNTVTITRAHKGIKGALFTGVNNVNYVRLYVPRGSELLDANGFAIPDRALFETPDASWSLDDDLAYAALTRTTHEQSRTDLYEEHGKTVFGNWIQTAPGTSSTATFRYRLPLRLFEDKRAASPYALTVQKQAGTIGRRTTISARVPSAVEVVWNPQGLEQVVYDDDSDAFFAVLLQKARE